MVQSNGDVSTLRQMADMPDAISWHPNRSDDVYKAVKELLGEPGTNLEQMLTRTRLTPDDRAALNIALQKAYALEELRTTGKTNGKPPIPTAFEYLKMPAVMRAVYFHSITGIPGPGDARFEITSALTGGFFSSLGRAARSPFGMMRNMVRGRRSEGVAG